MDDRVLLMDDVLIEILVNLPIKSILRFRCVSKYWCVLINSPNFVTRHLNRDCNEIVFLKRKLPGCQVFSFHDLDSPNLFVSPNHSIPQFFNDLVCGFCRYVGTCNGLVCLEFKEIIILCNPALREFKLLPPTPFTGPEGRVAAWVVTRFGFDATTNAYKVVQIRTMVDRKKDEYFDEARVRIDLYNSSTNSWRLIDAVVPWVIDDQLFNLFFNGACHWSANPGVILSLDLSTEVFRQFEYPMDRTSISLAVLNECLSLLDCDKHVVDIWVMKEYGVKESWTKVFTVRFDATINYPILLLKNEWLLLKINNQLASCALYRNEIKGFHIQVDDEPARAVIFKESLISLKQIIFCGEKD